MPLAAQRIVVIGSMNMDLVCRTARRPVAGQTVMGSTFMAVPGGKGANQAVAAARMGGDTHFIGRVGDDDFGRTLVAGLGDCGIHTQYVTTTAGVSSGVAIIVVDERGENSIVVVPGANHCLTPADIDAAESLIRSAAVVVMQLEIPFRTVTHVIRMCRRLGVYTILDPAPAPPAGLPDAMYDVDLLTPNESEAIALIGAGDAPRDNESIGRALLARGPRRVVLKLGAAGAMNVEANRPAILVAGFKVQVVDTTAAGDAFTATLAVALAEGRDIAAAMRLANAAGARCCESAGARSLPSRRESR